MANPILKSKLSKSLCVYVHAFYRKCRMFHGGEVSHDSVNTKYISFSKKFLAWKFQDWYIICKICETFPCETFCVSVNECLRLTNTTRQTICSMLIWFVSQVAPSSITLMNRTQALWYMYTYYILCTCTYAWHLKILGSLKF